MIGFGSNDPFFQPTNYINRPHEILNGNDWQNAFYGYFFYCMKSGSGFSKLSEAITEAEFRWNHVHESQREIPENSLFRRKLSLLEVMMAERIDPSLTETPIFLFMRQDPETSEERKKRKNGYCIKTSAEGFWDGFEDDFNERLKAQSQEQQNPKVETPQIDGDEPEF